MQLMAAGLGPMLAAMLLAAGAVQAGETEQMAAKRRQQGILTGMPFMANLASRTFVDDAGRKIFLADPPTRIVSLAPSVTEMLFAIGAGEQVIGVTQFCDYPPDAKTKPKVGASFPNVESLVILKPDLVVASKDFIRPDTLSKLEQLKIPTFVLLDAKTMEDVFAHIQTLGRMLNRSSAADALIASMRQRTAAVKAKTASLRRPRVLYVLNSDPFITVGSGSFIHHLIELAGGTNVAAGTPVSYPRLSLEEVVRQDPEVILFPVGTEEGIPDQEQQRWLRWTTLSAVKQNRFVRIPSVLLDRPGPRIVEGLELLARQLHPDLFPSGGTR
jgi:ABC-type Fe3+-hydroxamate transport system substrate-binding protein